MKLFRLPKDQLVSLTLAGHILGTSENLASISQYISNVQAGEVTVYSSVNGLNI